MGGSLRVLDIDPADAGPELRLRIGYAPEHHNLPPDMHAADFVRHIAQLHGIPRQASTERASDALWLVGLGEERFRPIGTMSTGQRQRVKLAQAIAHDPASVMLDEPTDGARPGAARRHGCSSSERSAASSASTCCSPPITSTRSNGYVTRS